MARFFSVAGKPGRTGTFFYNHFFARLGMPHTYEALGSANISETIADLRLIPDIGGISITMPFKSEIISHLDHADEHVLRYGACNTVVIRDRMLIGHNADLAGAEHVISLLEPTWRISILGAGCMGRMFKELIGPRAVLFSRSLGNWEERHGPTDAIINATSIGTTVQGTPLDDVKGIKIVIDLATSRTDLSDLCLDQGVPYANGMTFYKHQFIKQFKLYTDVDIDAGSFDRAQQGF